jgi:hypothetical protein
VISRPIALALVAPAVFLAVAIGAVSADGSSQVRIGLVLEQLGSVTAWWSRSDEVPQSAILVTTRDAPHLRRPMRLCAGAPPADAPNRDLRAFTAATTVHAHSSKSGHTSTRIWGVFAYT